MIWLSEKNDKERDIITCNKIVRNREKIEYLEQLKKDLYRNESYVLQNASAYKGEELREFDKDPVKMSINHKLGFDRMAGHLYARTGYINPKANSLIFLIELNKSQYEKKSDIKLLDMFGGDVSKISMVEKLRVSLDDETFAFLMNKIWEDFYFFTTEILGNVSFEEVSRYDIEELRNIQMLCDKNNVETSAVKILEHVEQANDNSKVLRLARMIRNR